MKYTFSLPYDKSSIPIEMICDHSVDFIEPKCVQPEKSSDGIIANAIRNPLYNYDLPDLNKNSRVVITVNDKTRPVPNNLLFPPLLERLLSAGVKKENTTILIASGTHVPMRKAEFGLLFTEPIINQYRIIAHNCDEEKNLTYKGTTSRGTPVFVNTIFDQSDLRIVVGDIEPHHFAGFSGGVKSASIGVCGRRTINANHSFLMDPKSHVGSFFDNPLRQDIEEIGEMINVNFALNAVLNEKKEILHVFWGSPQEVILKGIEVCRENSMIEMNQSYDLVIASAGGYPKDINLYQAQKALTHASLFCRQNGMVLLSAACTEGVGNDAYIRFMEGIKSHQDAIEQLKRDGFSVGPHKAYQFASIAQRVNFKIKSEIRPEMMKKLLITPVDSFQEEVNSTILALPEKARIAVIPHATATIPFL